MRYGKSKQKTPFVFYLGIALLLLVMITTHMSTGLFARYLSYSQGGDSARAASFGLGAGETLTEDFELTLEPGTSEKKSIKISYSGEVAVKYTVTAQTAGNLPLKLSWAAQEGEFSAGSAQSHEYELTVSWEGTKKDYLYSYEVDYITITVVCEQVD